jgi:uncharacterized protein YndB with AHSA1/START domain
MDSTGTDRIEKTITLRAPRARVWRALTDAQEFGEWFRVRLEGKFEPGATLRGFITHPGYEHLRMDITIERLEPERLVSWRWHPYAIDANRDYTREPTTLVTFELVEVAGGTRLELSETGFDQLPPERRAEAFRMNDGGWSAQMVNIERHVAPAG